MKEKIWGFIIVIIVSAVLFFTGMDTRVLGDPIEAYQVYLDGEKIGVIASKDELLDLIDREQEELKKQYNVDKVYPPNGLDIRKVYTYDKELVSESSIYDSIKDAEPFTIDGYTVTITYNQDTKNEDGTKKNPEKTKKIYLLEKSLIKDALYNLAVAFIGEENVDKYNKGTQTEIVDTGEIINSIYFDDTVTVKRDLISTEEYIFSDVSTLSRYLLYGTLEIQKTYKTQVGENLQAIASANHLNIEELLIANPQYKSANVLLAEGEIVNIGLIKPLVNIVYRKTDVKNVEISYTTEYESDNKKPKSYKVVTTKGQNGKSRITQEVRYVNGEIQSLQITNTDVITPVVNEVVTVGTKAGSGSTDYDKTLGNEDYFWPTLVPFTIGTRYEWRWGKHHDGIDIYGTGHGSPIYAVHSGTVYRTNYNKNTSTGIAVYIDHHNGYYTISMHLSKILVKEGQEVEKGQQIGKMGNTGNSYGTHLHLGVFTGDRPYSMNSKPIDPCKTIFRC